MSDTQSSTNLFTPILTSPLNDILTGINAPDTTLNLTNYFDDPYTTGLVANFQLSNPSIGNGLIRVLLFNQQGLGAPETVTNFRNYVDNNSYNNTFIHRSVPGFIIQGGGFTFDNLNFDFVPANSPVVNEFSPQRSNIRGTIAMAKLGNDPNSATNQWFFNLADNSANLNNQNGGFTVFGTTLADDDLNTIDTIASAPFYNGSTIHPAFSNLPLILDNPEQPQITQDDNLIRFSTITIAEQPELNFSIINNSQPDLVNLSIDGNQLVLDYLPEQTGTADISLRATNLLGQSVDYQFSINVLPLQPTSTQENLSTIPGAPVTIPLLYKSTENTPPEVNLRLYYNSNHLSFENINKLLTTNIFANITESADSNNLDNDPNTDRYLEFKYSNNPVNLPPAELPLKLTDLNFITQDSFTGTTLNISGDNLAPSPEVPTTSILITQSPWNLDIDGNGKVGALSDGIIAVRYMFGEAFAREKLTDGAISPDATRNLEEIQAYLQEGVERLYLDIDGNGKIEPLQDGIIAVRYMFGEAFADQSLTDGAISPDATRDLTQIQTYLSNLIN